MLERYTPIYHYSLQNIKISSTLEHNKMSYSESRTAELEVESRWLEP